MTDIDHLLRDHAAQAEATSQATGGWERLVDRLDDVAVPTVAEPVVSGRSRPLGWLAAAAVLVVVGVVVMIDAPRGDELLTTVPFTVPPGPSPSEPPAMPDHAVAVVREADGLERAVVLDRLHLGTSDNALPVMPGMSFLPVLDEGSGGSSLIGVDVAPDGSIYLETCCELSGPEIRPVYFLPGDADPPIDRGVLIDGGAPALSPDGRQMAVSREGRVVVVEIEESGDITGLLGPELEGRYATDLAWSPNGRHLARATIAYEGLGPDRPVVEVFDLRDPDSGWVPVGPNGGRGLAMPAFLADGRLAVGTDVGLNADGAVAGGIGVVDIGTGELQQRYENLQLTDLDAAADGSWIVASSGGAIRAFEGTNLADHGTIAQIDSHIVAIAW